MPIGGHVVLCGTLGIGGRIAEQLYRAGETMLVLEQFGSADLPVTEEVATVWFVGATGRPWSAGSA